MSRYLLTGATTPVGRELITQLLADPTTERVLAVGGEAGRADAFSDGRVAYTRADLRRERSIRELMFGLAREERINTVVDMATHRSTTVGRSAHALNVDETRRLLRFAERVESIDRFVYRSFGAVYRVGTDLPSVVDEDHPLRIGSGVSEYVLDLVEADLAVCARMGMSRIRIAVLRCAECLAPDMGSQLWDYLDSKVCFRPLGFDPMVNVLSERDMAHAMALAARSSAEGVFTIPGFDTLPLSRIIERFERREVAIPGPTMHLLYGLRRALTGGEFDYRLLRERLHFGFVLDGRRAREVLEFTPTHPVQWPLSLDRVGRRAQRANPKALRGALESLLRRDD